ncbi:porin [Pseudoduganella sp. LjRoot289]|uniref:porin n=1 Tax=Pseudoduganella sp. LjRoot289 TaxID=3342314 RepID=UPI003ECFB1C8
MKKSLLALAVFGTFAAAASAQSNTTIYGIVNIGTVYSKSDVAPTRWGVDSGGWYGSRLGFRGTEDLGNGLSVVYQLENGFSPDTGNLGQGGRLFGRHSWVGFKGDFGTVRFGRSWTPTYCLLTDVIDPFEDGMSGAAGAFFGRNIFNAIDIRMQNAVFYKHTIAGVTADVAYSLGEVAGNASANRQISTAFTYGTGPLKAVLGYQNINDVAGTGTARLAFVGGSYDFGMAKLHFGIDQQKTDAAGLQTVDASDVLLGVTVPVGAGRVLASYNRRNDRMRANVDMSQFAVGYTYDLSKRTSLYTSYGHVNLNDANRVDFGIRHKF